VREGTRRGGTAEVGRPVRWRAAAAVVAHPSLHRPRFVRLYLPCGPASPRRSTGVRLRLRHALLRILAARARPSSRVRTSIPARTPPAAPSRSCPRAPRSAAPGLWLSLPRAASAWLATWPADPTSSRLAPWPVGPTSSCAEAQRRRARPRRPSGALARGTGGARWSRDRGRLLLGSCGGRREERPLLRGLLRLAVERKCRMEAMVVLCRSPRGREGRGGRGRRSAPRGREAEEEGDEGARQGRGCCSLRWMWMG
jgi:hypothetical protein